MNSLKGNFARASAILKYGKFVDGHWRLGQQKVYRNYRITADFRWQEVIELRHRVPVIYYGDGRIIRQSRRILARRILLEDGFYYPNEYQQKFFELHDHCFASSLTKREAA